MLTLPRGNTYLVIAEYMVQNQLHIAGIIFQVPRSVVLQLVSWPPHPTWCPIENTLVDIVVPVSPHISADGSYSIHRDSFCRPTSTLCVAQVFTRLLAGVIPHSITSLVAGPLALHDKEFRCFWCIAHILEDVQVRKTALAALRRMAVLGTRDVPITDRELEG